MSALILPRRLSAQPQVAAPVDTGNPIARGLINLYSRGFDAATNRLVPANDNVQLVSTSLGMALPLSGSNYAELVSTIGSTGSVTFVASFISTAGGGTQNDIISLGDRCTLRINTNDNRLEFYTFDGADWQQENSVDGTVLPDLPTVAVAIHDEVAGTNQIYFSQAGVLTQSFGSSANPRSTGSHALRLGLDDETGRSLVGLIWLGGAFNRALSDAEARSLVTNPWQLLKANALASRFAIAAGDVPPVVAKFFTRGRITRRRSSIYDYSGAGWFDAQLVSPGVAFDGDYAAATSGGTGSASITLAAATLAATGALDIAGQTTATLAPATLAATGTVALAGSTAATLANATLTATGAVALSGTASNTLAAATLAATGTVALSGTASITLAGVTSAATGTVALAGASTPTLAPLTAAATGTLDLAGALATTLVPATSAATGALALAGATAQTLADATLLAAGEGSLNVGVAELVLANATAAATGVLPIVGAAATSLDAVTTAATGTIALSGAGTLLLADASLTATATLALSGAEALQLQDATLVATGVLALAAVTSEALDDATLSATGELTAFDAILGTAAITLDAASTTAAGVVALTGASAQTLQALALSAAGHVDIASQLGITLGNLTLASSAVLALSGSSDVLLADLAVLATATLQTSATRLSAQHAAWLEGIVRLHGLVDPLAVGPTLRGDGTVVQSIADAAGVVTLTTIAAPTGIVEDSALTVEQAGWLEALARLHGLIDPLDVSTTSRGDGTVLQSIATTGDSVLVERLQ